MTEAAARMLRVMDRAVTERYLAHVRGPAYESREHDFGFDCMEAPVFRGCESE